MAHVLTRVSAMAETVESLSELVARALAEDVGSGRRDVRGDGP